MGKRSDFERVPKDAYQTIDPRAVAALAPFLYPGVTFAEPCAGQGLLVSALKKTGCIPTYVSDIDQGHDALDLRAEDVSHTEFIITNPPWSRPLLHPLIEHLAGLRPTWLLFDADWAHTAQSVPYMHYCHIIVSVGRLLWIPGTTMTGKDNCAWYLFDRDRVQRHGGPVFFGRVISTARLQQVAE